MEYMVFEYYLDITFILWHCIMLHCIAFGVMSQTYGCDCTDTASVYWAWRYRLSIPCWIWRQEFICIRMHTSLVWHRDAASYLDEYEGRSSCALICIFLWLNDGCDGDMSLQTYIVPLGWHALWCGLWELDIPYECLLHSVALLHGYLDIDW